MMGECMATKEEKNTFSAMIMDRAATLKTDHMDAIVTYCEEVGIEMEVAAALINETLKARLYHEAMELNIVPKEDKLPI
jgi:glutaminase